MSQEEPEHPRARRHSRGRLRRSGRKMVKVGAILLIVSLIVTLFGGLTTRSMLNHLTSNSAELLDGSAEITLQAGTERTLYVTGGIVAPGEISPTPVDQIVCHVEGPGGEVPVSHLRDEDKRVGLDNPLARFQVIGHFRAQETGTHQVTCTGMGVVVAPEVEPASALLRLGALMLGSLGTFAGVTLTLLGGVLLLLSRRGEGQDEDPEDEDADGDIDLAQPPAEGAEEWWDHNQPSQHPADQVGAGAAVAHAGAGDEEDEDVDFEDADFEEGDAYAEEQDFYVEMTQEELDELSEEEIAELLRSGALVYVDEDGKVISADEEDDETEDDRSTTYR
ncbi:hypothetical protein [Ornithinimicrobium sp. Y1694]|uniref:hypothetical protein n=1 Tax=Ornithinimicrobium sp. Y1694 TaxID=3418590 RepID=UPI003CF199A9